MYELKLALAQQTQVAVCLVRACSLTTVLTVTQTVNNCWVVTG